MAATTTPQGNTQSNFARAKKTAAFFEVSRSTLWHWSKNREGFPQPLKAGGLNGRVTLWDLNSIEAYLKSQAVSK